MQFGHDRKGMTFVTFEYLFLQKITIPILINILPRNLERGLTLITFHYVSWILRNIDRKP